MSTDLVKHESTAGVIVLNEGGGDYNILTPTLVIPDSEGVELRTSVVRLDPRDFYKVQGRFAPSAAALFRLMDAASIFPESSKAVTASVCAKCAALHREAGTALVCAECGHCYDVAHTVTIAQQLPGGQWRRITASYELDFMALQEELEMRPASQPSKVKAELAQKRRHRAALAETGAYARALRKALGVTSYTEAETRKPFLVHRMVTKLSDAQARQVLERNSALLHDDGEAWDVSEPPQIAAPAEAQAVELEPEPEPEMDPVEVYEAGEEAPKVDVYAMRDVLKGAATDLEARNAGKVPSPGQLNLLHVLLEKATGSHGDAATAERHSLLRFLFGKSSSGALTYGELYSLLNALVDQERSDRESRKYELSGEGRAMIHAALGEQTRLDGQGQLFDDAS